jgi:hypothetical protein
LGIPKKGDGATQFGALSYLYVYGRALPGLPIEDIVGDSVNGDNGAALDGDVRAEGKESNLRGH